MIAREAPRQKKAKIQNVELGGEGEIRTRETIAGLPVFKTGALNHYATSPSLKFWRKGWDSNPRSPYELNTLAVCCFRPLSHLSIRQIFVYPSDD